MKSLLFVFLTMFMLAGCGTNNNGSSIGTQEEPTGQEEEYKPEGPTNDAAPEGENGMTGDEKSDMSDTNGEINEPKDANK